MNDRAWVASGRIPQIFHDIKMIITVFLIIQLKFSQVVFQSGTSLLHWYSDQFSDNYVHVGLREHTPGYGLAATTA